LSGEIEADQKNVSSFFEKSKRVGRGLRRWTWGKGEQAKKGSHSKHVKIGGGAERHQSGFEDKGRTITKPKCPGKKSLDFKQ